MKALFRRSSWAGGSSEKDTVKAASKGDGNKSLKAGSQSTKSLSATKPTTPTSTSGKAASTTTTAATSKAPFQQTPSETSNSEPQSPVEETKTQLDSPATSAPVSDTDKVAENEDKAVVRNDDDLKGEQSPVVLTKTLSALDPSLEGLSDNNDFLSTVSGGVAASESVLPQQPPVGAAPTEQPPRKFSPAASIPAPAPAPVAARSEAPTTSGQPRNTNEMGRPPRSAASTGGAFTGVSPAEYSPFVFYPSNGYLFVPRPRNVSEQDGRLKDGTRAPPSTPSTPLGQVGPDDEDEEEEEGIGLENMDWTSSLRMVAPILPVELFFAPQEDGAKGEAKKTTKEGYEISSSAELNISVPKPAAGSKKAGRRFTGPLPVLPPVPAGAFGPTLAAHTAPVLAGSRASITVSRPIEQTPYVDFLVEGMQPYYDDGRDGEQYQYINAEKMTNDYYSYADSGVTAEAAAAAAAGSANPFATLVSISSTVITAPFGLFSNIASTLASPTASSSSSFAAEDPYQQYQNQYQPQQEGGEDEDLGPAPIQHDGGLGQQQQSRQVTFAEPRNEGGYAHGGYPSSSSSSSYGGQQSYDGPRGYEAASLQQQQYQPPPQPQPHHETYQPQPPQPVNYPVAPPPRSTENLMASSSTMQLQQPPLPEVTPTPQQQQTRHVAVPSPSPAPVAQPSQPSPVVVVAATPNAAASVPSTPVAAVVETAVKAAAPSPKPKTPTPAAEEPAPATTTTQPTPQLQAPLSPGLIRVDLTIIVPAETPDVGFGFSFKPVVQTPRPGLPDIARVCVTKLKDCVSNGQPVPNPSAQAGLRLDDVIEAVNGKTAPTTAELLQLIKTSGNNMVVTVSRAA